jgi:hypothetical protein
MNDKLLVRFEKEFYRSHEFCGGPGGGGYDGAYPEWGGGGASMGGPNPPLDDQKRSVSLFTAAPERRGNPYGDGKLKGEWRS